MKPSAKDNEDLLRWAAGVLHRAQSEGIYGTVTLHFERGKIIRAKTERSEKPPKGLDTPETPE